MSAGALNEVADRASRISDESILAEAKTLAAKEASGTIGAIKTLPNALGNINFLELLLSLATIFIIYGFKRITSAVPSTLVALIVVSSGAFFLGLDYTPIEKIPEGLPVPQLEMFSSFSFSSISPYIITAFTLSLLGAIDSLLTSVVADNMTKTKHNSNKELVGQGIGNSIAAVFGGIPGAGATIRTVVNIQSGGKNKAFRNDCWHFAFIYFTCSWAHCVKNSRSGPLGDFNNCWYWRNGLQRPKSYSCFAKRRLCWSYKTKF